VHRLTGAEPLNGFPSLTPHTNPNHFSNIAPYTSNMPMSFDNPNAFRPSSPLSAQPFAQTLRAPTMMNVGLIQPALAEPVPWDASAIERARAVHGPNCKSIPKLVISPHANPSTGKQSLYSMCPDCGSVEQAA
jgi:hypothetical protein